MKDCPDCEIRRMTEGSTQAMWRDLMARVEAAERRAVDLQSALFRATEVLAALHRRGRLGRDVHANLERGDRRGPRHPHPRHGEGGRMKRCFAVASDRRATHGAPGED